MVSTLFATSLWNGTGIAIQNYQKKKLMSMDQILLSSYLILCESKYTRKVHPFIRSQGGIHCVHRVPKRKWSIIVLRKRISLVCFCSFRRRLFAYKRTTDKSDRQTWGGGDWIQTPIHQYYLGYLWFTWSRGTDSRLVSWMLKVVREYHLIIVLFHEPV